MGEGVAIRPAAAHNGGGVTRLGVGLKSRDGAATIQGIARCRLPKGGASEEQQQEEEEAADSVSVWCGVVVSRWQLTMMMACHHRAIEIARRGTRYLELALAQRAFSQRVIRSHT